MDMTVTIVALVVIFFAAFLIGWIAFDNLKRHLPKSKKAVKSKSNDKEVVWKACPPGYHEKVSKGIDITEKMIALGADELPTGAKYAFFEEIHIQNPNPQFEILSEKYSNRLAIVWHPEDGNPCIATHEADPRAFDPEDELLCAASEAFRKFAKEHANYVRAQNFKAFLTNDRPNADLYVIGERQSEWKDDN